MKDRLIELISYFGDGYKAENRRVYETKVVDIADHLLANGVVVPPVKVGQTVWVYNQSVRNIYKNTVVCVKIMGESKYKNKIVVEYRNPYGESSHRKFTWAQIGKQVFLTEEEAVEALAERSNR